MRHTRKKAHNDDTAKAKGYGTAKVPCLPLVLLGNGERATLWLVFLLLSASFNTSLKQSKGVDLTFPENILRNHMHAIKRAASMREMTHISMNQHVK
jgi:hypothetical protein